MKIKNYLTLIFLFAQIFIFVKANECGKVYIAPFFSKLSMCYKRHDTCSQKLREFVGYCISAKNKLFVTTLDFNHNSTFTCITSRFDTACSDQYAENNLIYLKQGKNYGIKRFIFDEIKIDGECGENSLIIFLLNIPCTQIESFPDFDELFGKGWNRTSEEIKKKKAYFLMLILSDTNHDLEMCRKMFGDLDFSENNNIKIFTKKMNEVSVFGIKLCETPIPRFYSPHPNTSVKPPPNVILATTLTITCAVVLALIIAWFVFWALRVRRRWQESKIEAFATEHTRNARHILFGKYRDEWEVTPKELKIDSSKIIGKGAFGVVYKGHLKKQRDSVLIEMDVAVKFTTEFSTEQMRQDMISEIGFMKSLGSHENLLVMVGYVKSIENPMICTIFCENGDLLQILRKHPLHFMSQNKCDSVEICLLLPDLLRISIEICNGLCYLSSLNYVHRDIAARNVLLTKNMTAKLSDFGLCRQLENGKDYLVEKEGKFPIKYMPYESIKHGRFSQKSDVWTFGILMVEMFSGGEKPFDDIPNEEFIEHLENGGRPEFSENVPNEIVEILYDNCFQKEPELRLTFEHIKNELEYFYHIVLSLMQ